MKKTPNNLRRNSVPSKTFQIMSLFVASFSKVYNIFFNISN